MFFLSFPEKKVLKIFWDLSTKTVNQINQTKKTRVIPRKVKTLKKLDNICIRHCKHLTELCQYVSFEANSRLTEIGLHQDNKQVCRKKQEAKK